MNQFAKNLRTLRLQRKLKQSDMLDALGFTQARWSSYEAQAAKPSINDLMSIAAFFNISETDLLHADLSSETTPGDTASDLKGLILSMQARIENLEKDLKKKRR